MIRDKITKLFKEEIELEHPVNPDFGDYSTNYALKKKIDPKKIVKEVSDNPLFEKVEVVNGFVNFFLSAKALQDELKEIIEQGDKYGNLEIGKDRRIQVEFISANPTGPLTVGNARGGPFGDALANVLAKAGYGVEREYYVNDYGAQIEALGHSVLKDAEAKYQGEYIDELNKRNKEVEAMTTGEWAADEIIEEIKRITSKLGIKFDSWLKESELYQSGLVDKVLQILEKKDLIYEKEEAVWFKAENFGDNRDRVVIKSNGYKTYLAGDIAHHYYKFKEKKFDRVINVWGADHHGDVTGLQAGVKALECKGKLDIILMQFVTLMEKGVSKKMSKRAGDYITMDELIDKVGKDAVRFFFLQKSPDTHLNFDLELAKEQSLKNPVIYVQYAHARICSVLKKGNSVIARSEATKQSRNNFGVLTHPSELNLIRCLAKYPEIIEDTARDYQVQRLPYYSLELANSFHRFYEDCRVLDSDSKEARIGLIKATQIILKDVLNLMGVEAPEKM